MKPTFKTSRAAHFGETRAEGITCGKAPAIEWSYREPMLRGNGGSGSFPMPSFRRLSDAYFAREARKESRLEGYLFGIIVAMGAWPIISAILVVAGVLR
jgi:hypothetical protein